MPAGDRRVLVHRDAKDRARHVVLLAGERTIGLTRRLHQQVVLDRQTELEAERRRASNRDHRAAVVQELLDRRERDFGRQVALHRLELGRDRRGGTTTATATATATSAAATDAHVRREDDHVVLGLEVAGVEILRVHDRERNLEVLELEARPAGRHRAAVTIGERDALGRQLLRVSRTRRRRHEADAEVRRRLLQHRQRRRRDEERARRDTSCHPPEPATWSSTLHRPP